MSFIRFRKKTTSPNKSPSKPRSSPLRTSPLPRPFSARHGGASPLKLWEDGTPEQSQEVKRSPLSSAVSRVSSASSSDFEVRLTFPSPSTVSKPVPKKKKELANKEWEDRLSQMYIRLLNGRLRERRESGEVNIIQDLAQDLKDGIVLFHLSEVLSNFPLPGKLCTNPQTRDQAIQNLNMTFQALSDMGVKMVKVSPDDIYEGNMKRILGLLWTTILFFALRDSQRLIPPNAAAHHFQPPETQQSFQTPHSTSTDTASVQSELTPRSGVSTSSSDTTPPAIEVRADALRLKAELAIWAGRIAEVPVDGNRLTSVFRDGRLFAKIIRRLLLYKNDIGKDVDDYEQSKTPEQNMERSFTVAQAVLGVPVLIHPVAGESLDEVALVAYLSELQHAVLKRQGVAPSSGNQALSLEEALQDTLILKVHTSKNTNNFITPQLTPTASSSGSCTIQHKIQSTSRVDASSSASASVDIDTDTGTESRIAPCPSRQDEDDDQVEFIEDDPRASRISQYNKDRAFEEAPITESSSSPYLQNELESSAGVLNDKAIINNDGNEIQGDTAVIEIFRCPESASTGHIPEPALHQARIKVAVGVHRARGLFGGRSINPYCIVRYADVEIISPHIDSTSDPIWNYTALFDVDLPIVDNKHALITVYVFSANTLMADSLLGKVELLLWNLLDMSNPDDDPWGFTEEEAYELGGLHDVLEEDEEDDESRLSEETATDRSLKQQRHRRKSKEHISSMRERTSYLDVSRCLMQRSFLSVTPCDTTEHESLRKSSNQKMSRSTSRNSVQRAINPFHDKNYLYKNAGWLGALELSVFSMGRF